MADNDKQVVLFQLFCEREHSLLKIYVDLMRFWDGENIPQMLCSTGIYYVVIYNPTLITTFEEVTGDVNLSVLVCLTLYSVRGQVKPTFTKEYHYSMSL